MKEMSEAEIAAATALADKYHKCKNEGRKQEVRNKLFDILHTWMLRWVKNILYKWHFKRDDQEALSYSFPAMLFCLEHWKTGGKYHLPGHFYTYTRYYLLCELAKETSVHIELNELRETLCLIPSDLNIAFNSMLTMFEIRGCLPDFAQPAFDDAVSSVVYGKVLRKQNRHIDGNMYERLRRSFIPIVEYFVKRDLK